jgi:hypothetical protein
VAAACTSPGCRDLKGKGKGEVAYQVLQMAEHQVRSKWPSEWRMSSFSDCAVDPELEPGSGPLPAQASASAADHLHAGARVSP